MSNISEWSNDESGNNASPPNGAPEDATLISDLNDIERETMAAVRRWYESPDYRDLGHTILASASTTSILLQGLVESFYSVGQAIQWVDDTGTVAGTITSVDPITGNTQLTVSETVDPQVTAMGIGPNFGNYDAPYIDKVPTATDGNGAEFLDGEVVDSGGPISSIVTSTAQTTYTAGEAWTSAHGQSSEPDLVYAFAVCINADQGFVTDDIVKMPISHDNAAFSGVMPWADDTDLGGFMTANAGSGDDGGIWNKVTGTVGIMGVGDWNIYIKGVWF
jgi:hypothetical protein